MFKALTRQLEEGWMTVTRHALSLFLALSVFASAHAAATAGAADDGDAAFKLKDYGKAMKLLMPLAQRGDPVAETDVGIMYYGGLGVPVDRAEGVKWFMSSAKQGTLGGEVDMGIAYATGEGIRQDRLQAYMWFSLAADQGSASAVRYRDHITTELKPDEVQRAQDMANTCRNSKLKICGLP
jgi:TPR repeat protein